MYIYLMIYIYYIHTHTNTDTIRLKDWCIKLSTAMVKTAAQDMNCQANEVSDY